MKSFVSLLSLLSALSLYAFDFTPYRTIVCFGDSITHGGFYPMYLQQYHAENDPGHPRRFINRGISGNTVKDLLDRADEMLKTDKPDLVLVMIGTNDLLFTTKFAEKNLPFEDAAKKYPVFQHFEKQLGSLLDLFKQRGVAVVLLATPPYNETSNPAIAAPLNANMDSSGVRNILVIEQRLAREKGAVWIDIHAPLLKNLQDHDSGTPRSKSDRVHPSKAEHLIIARTILGQNWVPGTAKAAAAEKYRQAQAGIQGALLNMQRIPASCKTTEEKIAFYENWVARLKGVHHTYWSKQLPGLIELVKNPEKKFDELHRKQDAAFNELYRK